MKKGGTECRLEGEQDFVVVSIGFDRADECLTAYAPSLTTPQGIHTPLHTRYVRAPHDADGRIPIRGFKDWLPTAAGLRPTRVVS
jgi:hypothetical protein